MPKIEPKYVQKELEMGKVRPFYWIYGPERMKSRELIRRLQKAVLQDEIPNDFNYEKLDASEVSVDVILDSLQSFSMMGGTKQVLIRNAEEIKNLEPLVEYLKTIPSSDPVPASELATVAIFVSKNFDGRKKASKAIQDHGAVVSCEEVLESDREPWIDYLAKRRSVVLTQDERLLLRGLDPWSLDIVDQELSKVELVGNDQHLRQQVMLSGVDARSRDDFIDAIFCRDFKRALKWVHLFHEDIEIQLPILGLISWNLRHLKLVLLEQQTLSRSPEKRNPYLMKNLDRWKKHWTIESIQGLEHGLFEIDFSLKNTRLIGPGLWTNLLIEAAP